MTEETYEMPITTALGEYFGAQKAKMTTFWFTDLPP